MNRSLPILLATVALLASSCRRESLSPSSDPTQAGEVLVDRAAITPVPDGDPLTRPELDRAVIGMLEQRNDFQWEWVDLRTLWSATLVQRS